MLGYKRGECTNDLSPPMRRFLMLLNQSALVSDISTSEPSKQGSEWSKGSEVEFIGANEPASRAQQRKKISE